jgi:DNA-binding NtrC family response regulator
MAIDSRKVSVIVVDDDAAITRLVALYLEAELEYRVSVQTFNDAHLAQQQIDGHGCDLLISDIEMPGLDGLEMLRFCKHRNPWTQVIFMTAHSTWDRLNEAIEHGASDYLLKPIMREELTRVVLNECDRLGRWRQAVAGTFRSMAKV